MKPIRIKYYGLMWMTKSTYLIILTIAAVFAVVVLLGAIAFAGSPVSQFPWDPALNGKSWAYRVYNWWFLVGMLILQAIDTTVVLIKFRQKETEAQCRPAEDQPAAPCSQDTSIKGGDDRFGQRM